MKHDAGCCEHEAMSGDTLIQASLLPAQSQQCTCSFCGHGMLLQGEFIFCAAASFWEWKKGRAHAGQDGAGGGEREEPGLAETSPGPRRPVPKDAAERERAAACRARRLSGGCSKGG